MALLDSELFDFGYDLSRKPEHIEERIIQRNVYRGEITSRATYADMYRRGAAEMHIHFGWETGVLREDFPIYTVKG